MDAIILAAGLGTRLRPHTLTTPKPLLPVRGRPILDWTLAALPPAVDRVVVVVNYLAEQIEATCGGRSHFGTGRRCAGEPRGTGDALRSCRGQVRSDRLLVLTATTCTAPPTSPRWPRSRPACSCVKSPSRGNSGSSFTRPDGTLGTFGREAPDLDGRQLANIGAYLFPRSALDTELPLSPRGEYEITDAVSAVAARQPFFAVPARVWLPIGDEAAWRAAEELDLEMLLLRESSDSR